MKSKINGLVYAALLTAMAIVIPTSFGFLRIQIPPFTATIGSHVPMFIAMIISPATAAFVGVGSAIGFLITSPLVVAARAFTHVFVGVLGAAFIERDLSLFKTIIITAPLHGALEAVIVMPFGFTWYNMLVVVGVGTIIHHLIDGLVAYAIIKALDRAKVGK